MEKKQHWIPSLLSKARQMDEEKRIEKIVNILTVAAIILMITVAISIIVWALHINYDHYTITLYDYNGNTIQMYDGDYHIIDKSDDRICFKDREGNTYTFSNGIIVCTQYPREQDK